MRRFIVRAVLAVLIAVPLSAALAQEVQPQQSKKSDPMDPELAKDRRYALELYDQNKYIEAIPWLEKLSGLLPMDAKVHEALGASLVSRAQTLPTPEEQKAERMRARKMLLRAKELGADSDLLKILLHDLPEDGSGAVFSSDAEVDKVMQKAEADFAANRYDAAKDGYLRALLLNPHLYSAALFLGDVYLMKKEFGAAGEWYKRAVSIDPNKETAYRYWGDALAQMGKSEEARQKYIEAVIAEPYKQASWAGVNKVLRFTKKEMTWYKFKSPNAFEVKDDKNSTITLDSASLDKKDGSTAWMMYEMVRVSWRNKDFKKEYPAEKEYRHSLKEEAAALSGVATVALETTKEAKLNDEMKALVRLQKAGFIEPYVLLNGADDGIAQDYAGYREKHRDKLIQYLNEIVVPPIPKESK
jgi:tetratricopeptide (TPR) repeat protein